MKILDRILLPFKFLFFLTKKKHNLIDVYESILLYKCHAINIDCEILFFPRAENEYLMVINIQSKSGKKKTITGMIEDKKTRDYDMLKSYCDERCDLLIPTILGVMS